MIKLLQDMHAICPNTKENNKRIKRNKKRINNILKELKKRGEIKGHEYEVLRGANKHMCINIDMSFTRHGRVTYTFNLSKTYFTRQKYNRMTSKVH